MLLEQTEQLINKLNSFKTLQESSNESQHFNKRNEDLKSISLYLDGLSLMVVLFRNQGFEVDVTNIIGYPSQLFTKLKENWLKDTKSIIKPNDFFTKVNLNNIENEIRTKLNLQWQDFIESNKPNINFAQLDALEKIPDFSETVHKLKQSLQDIEMLKQKLPMQVDEFDLIKTITLHMSDLWMELSSNNIPTSVSNFLNKAGDEGINLSEITPEILEWLKANNLIHLCQVKFRK